MTRTASKLAIALAVVLAALVQGCGGKSCVDLCTQAQAGSCTSVRGNCSSFCNALGEVKGPASCGTAYDEYQTCLSRGSDVCANSCGSQESALTTCVTTYCVAHPSDANCTTLAASF
jgi:hypothetical protein